MEEAEKRKLAREHLGPEPDYRTYEEFASSSWNSWLLVDDEKAITGLHASLVWEPYLHVGDGGPKIIGYRRGDGAGYVLPQRGGHWWATWAHPMLCGRPGWHHHALGTYPSATAAAMAFDSVYDLERRAGNVDRCPELRVAASPL